MFDKKKELTGYRKIARLQNNLDKPIADNRRLRASSSHFEWKMRKRKIAKIRAQIQHGNFTSTLIRVLLTVSHVQHFINTIRRTIRKIISNQPKKKLRKNERTD